MPKTFNVQRCLVHTVRYRHYSTTPEPIIFDNDAEAKQQREELEKEAKLKKRKMWTWAAIGTCLVIGASSQYFIYQYLKKHNEEQKQLQLEYSRKTSMRVR